MKKQKKTEKIVRVTLEITGEKVNEAELVMLCRSVILQGCIHTLVNFKILNMEVIEG